MIDERDRGDCEMLYTFLHVLHITAACRGVRFERSTPSERENRADISS